MLLVLQLLLLLWPPLCAPDHSVAQKTTQLNLLNRKSRTQESSTFMTAISILSNWL